MTTTVAAAPNRVHLSCGATWYNCAMKAAFLTKAFVVSQAPATPNADGRAVLPDHLSLQFTGARAKGLTDTELAHALRRYMRHHPKRADRR